VRNRSRVFNGARILAITIALSALALLTTLPLGWQEQATFGSALIALALLLHLAFRSRTVTHLLMAASVFATARYGYWRTLQTWEGLTSAGHLRQVDVIFVLLLLFAEFYAFATLILGYFQTVRPLGRQPVPLPSDSQTWPTVDVFIPTYNEPLTVVRATVLGVLAMDYPADKLHVVLLDDGRRDEFRTFASDVGVGYMSRATNVHAKAGNINNALEHTTGEFVAIFDADHVPTSTFLLMTLGPFLNDGRVGLVQTPHHFYSPDPFERNLKRFRKVPNESELFHRLVQDGNDLWNASFFCGSCAVLRREALATIGGVAVETVVEDAHTAVRLHGAGWNTVYLNIPLAAGLATESLAAHIGQRIRWARGMIQVLRLENPLFRRGLSFPQRLCYFNATTHFLFAVPRLIFLTIPLVYLIFGRVNIYGYSLAVFAYAFPHIALSHLASSRSQRQYRFSFWNEIYEAVLAPYILLPTLLALINPRLGKFNVTSKGGVIKRSYFDHRIAFPLLCLLGLNVAGLLMARYRYLVDPAHHDTIIMNALWTTYNIVILSVAASVAWERRQRRSEVRVDVRVPLTVMTFDGRRVAAATSQLSRGGATAHFDNPVGLPRGSPVVLRFREGGGCAVQARVVGGRGRTRHLAFSPLELHQEKYLLGLAFSHSQAWSAWHHLRRSDRPLRSGLEVLVLAVRGFSLVIVGLCVRKPARVDTASNRARRRAAVIGALALGFGLYPARALAQQQPAFEDTIQLGALSGSPGDLALGGSRAVENVFLDLPVTKIVTNATLELRYDAPAAGNGGVLELWLNETLVAALPLVAGSEVRVDVSLPTDLFTTANALSFRLKTTCADCAGGPAPLMTIRPDTTLRLRGSRLPLGNDLSLLPIPFIDPTGQRSSVVPVAFSDEPATDVLRAAGIIASWFGVFSDVRGARFPVTVGELPAGNAVVFARRGSPLAARLALPPTPDALVAMRDNPRDPYGKLLVVVAGSSSDFVAAARTLVSRDRFEPRTNFLPADPAVASVPSRPRYDAPRWLQSNRPAPIGTYTSSDRLKIQGSGSINIFFRLPPDLFLSARQSVPLQLKYQYAGVSGGHAAFHVRLNAEDVDSVHLSSAQSAQRTETVWLPTGRLRPYANTLTIDFDPGEQARGDVWPTAAIHQDSSIDLRGLPHSVILPRLELFADAGYPFTAWADLGRTAIVISDRPTRGEYEAVLNMLGAFGAQTGAPAPAVSVTTAAALESVGDKDLIVFGTAADQPILRRWEDHFPLKLLENGFSVDAGPIPARWFHPEWPFREADRRRLAVFSANRSRVDTVIEQIVSPLARERSVVAIVPRDATRYETIPEMFMPAVRKGPLYGGVAISLDGRFESFLVGSLAYRSGDLGRYEQAMVFLFEHSWLLPLLVLGPALVVALEVRRFTDRVAARRLAVSSAPEGRLS
jgi:cellulose synthase (UDP-forming)